MDKAFYRSDGRDPDFIGVARAYRNESNRVFAAIEYPRRFQFLADEILQNAAFVGLVIFQGDFLHPRRHGRNHRVSINLSMRMMQGDADFRAAILKRQYIIDPRKTAQ